MKTNNIFTLRLNNIDDINFIKELEKKLDFKTTSDCIRYIINNGICYEKQKSRTLCIMNTKERGALKKINRSVALNKLQSEANTMLLVRIYTILLDLAQDLPFRKELVDTNYYDTIPDFIKNMLDGNIDNYMADDIEDNKNE